MDVVQNALADRYRMWLHTAYPHRHVSPLLNLVTCLDLVNRAIRDHGPEVTTWPWEAKREGAKLVRVSWIYQHLDQEPIRKPLLCHLGPDQQLHVDCGDSRIMALDLHGGSWSVPVVVTRAQNTHWSWPGWMEIHSERQLLETLGLWDPVHSRVHLQDLWLDQHRAFGWMEIGSPVTQHHMADLDQRARMLQAYLLAQPSGFQWDTNTARQPIAWYDYDS